MTATLTMRAFTGSGAATMSGPISTTDLCAADALSGGPVVHGTVSYERWIALRVDVAPTTGVSNFSLINTGDLPAGVSIKFGVTDTPRTPVNTVSDIATKDLTSGRQYIWDTNVYDDIGELTRYLVIQETASGSAPAGPINPQALLLGWTES